MQSDNRNLNGQASVGILGVGAALPSQVRPNSWWSDDAIEQMKIDISNRRKKKQGELRSDDDAQSSVLTSELADPFAGIQERRILEDHQELAEFETLAAQEAMSKAGIEASQIDFVFSYSFIPDTLETNRACFLHQRLDLRPTCIALDMNATCNTFQMQLMFAQQMISSGQSRYGLIIQSSASSRVLPQNNPGSTHFGDGATAIVVGPAPADGQGIIAQAHRTQSNLCSALACNVPNKRWWEDGPIQLLVEDPSALDQMIVTFLDFGSDVMNEVFGVSKRKPSEVNFFACHQPTSWVREEAQVRFGFANAKSVNSYAKTGTLGTANLPYSLYLGQKEGLLRSGDLVALFQGGSGATFTATLLEWC